MEEKTWNRLKVGIENRMLITLGPGSLDINLLFLAAVVFISRPLQDSSGRKLFILLQLQPLSSVILRL